MLRTILAVISFLVFPVGWILGAWQIFRKKNQVFGTILIGLGTLELVLFILVINSGPSLETEMDVDLDVEVSAGDSTPVPTPTNTPVAITPTPTATATPTPGPPTPLPTPTNIPVATPTPTDTEKYLEGIITPEQMSYAIMTLAGYDVVLDSHIQRDLDDKETYWLTVVVNYATNEETAIDMGDNFVRMLKNLGPDTNPGKEIGRGKFTYLIAVYYPNGTEIASGYKCPPCTNIRW